MKTPEEIVSGWGWENLREEIKPYKEQDEDGARVEGWRLWWRGEFCGSQFGDWLLLTDPEDGPLLEEARKITREQRSLVLDNLRKRNVRTISRYLEEAK